jgi:hypothetical protein
VRRPSATQVLLWAPVAFAIADLLVMLANGPELVRALHHNADVAASQMVGALYGQRGPNSVVTLGSHPWYESLWFMRATDWLPAKRSIWLLGPFVFSGAAVAGLGWTAWRLFGAWAGAMVAALLVCSSTAMRIVMFTPNWHGDTLVHAVLLCVVLVLLTQRADRLSTRALVLIGVPVAAVTALTVPDRLALVTSIGPFVGAALILWWRTGLPAQRRVAVLALLTMALAGAGGELAAHGMKDAGVIGIPTYHICFTDYQQLSSNLQILVAAFAALGGGVFFGRTIDAGSLGRFAAGVLTLGAALLVLRRLWAAAPRVSSRARATDAAAMAREAYVVFWSLGLLAVLGAFVISDVSWDILSSRFLSGGFLALAALVPVVLVRAPLTRLLVAGGIGVFTALSLGFHVAKGVGRWSEAGDLSKPTDRLIAYARANRLEVGYGGYNEAPVVTWLADERIKVYPVRECGARLCPYGAHTISSWYRPRPGVRTFLVTRPSGKGSSLTAPNALLGRPVAVRHFGPLTVYVYDHDLAANLGPLGAGQPGKVICSGHHGGA